MSSNLKVNTILPSVGTAIGIGTAGDTITSISSITITNGRIGIGTASPLQRLHIKGEGQGDHLLYLQAGDTICDIIQSDNGGSTRLRSANGSFYVWTGGDGNSSTGANGSPAIHVNTSLETKFYNTIKVVDKIEHDTDSDTSLRFPAEDTFSIETGGSERLRIDSNGYLGVGLGDPHLYYSPDLVVKAGAENGGITIRSAATTHNNYLMFADGNSGDTRYDGYIKYNHQNRFFDFATATSVRLRIDSDGRVMIGGGLSSPSSVGDGRLTVYSTDRLHAAIRGAGTSLNHANGYNLLSDNYTATESQLNLGVSYSGSGVVLSRSVKVSGSADDTYLSSQANYSTRPSAFKLDGDGSFVFLNTSTNANTAVDTAVSLTERVRIDSNGTVTKPLQPYVRITGITNQTGSGNATDGTATTQGDIAYSNGKVTVQVGGEYLITFASISDSGTGRVDGGIRVNGNNVVQLLTADNGTGYRQKSASIVVHLNVNDYVEWYNNDWYSASNTGTTWRTASVYMLG